MKRFLSIIIVILAVFLIAGIIGTAASPADEAFASGGEAMQDAKDEPDPAPQKKEDTEPAPQLWATSKYIWSSLTLIFAVLGTSWAQSRIGVAGAGAMAEKPELSGTYVILIAIPETMVILGFVIAAMLIVMA